MLYTSPSAAQYVLRADGAQGCDYTLRIDPADAITNAAPGVIVTLGPGREVDDIHRLYLDGQLQATVQGTDTQILSLGLLPETARLTFDAENTAGEWAWAAAITNQTDRSRITVFTETQSGGSSSEASARRIGLVRHVVLSPTGGVFESCGEAIAPTPCIDTVAPTVTQVSITRRFRTGETDTQGLARRSATRVGATIAYLLTEGAIARFELRPETKRVRVIRRATARCVASTPRTRRESRRDFGRRRARRCSSVYRKVRMAFTREGINGTNAFDFTGRVAGQTLRAGRYRLYVRATDLAGNAGRVAAGNTFLIVRR